MEIDDKYKHNQKLFGFRDYGETHNGYVIRIEHCSRVYEQMKAHEKQVIADACHDHDFHWRGEPFEDFVRFYDEFIAQLDKTTDEIRTDARAQARALLQSFKDNANASTQ